eukprot:CAMPEP_0202690292 /NCGR_PEP_ID=MMETSP1385-20130828/5310_1 /ASSEMBLY_ACC=CAM_ASM_000861 /TAXON_ID=933848 /ORGANISM="Elphidium margaritaceum" /LENGTH=550 /DNA_ID=CAMNT_0049345529 /DNA_START=42 /DNA_END=1694 /DNA_ORIENTATION=+
MEGMPGLDTLARSVSDFQNTGISIHYVSDWDLKEALRELVQNAVDGIVAYMKQIDANAKKADYKVDMFEHQHVNGVYRTFQFRWPAQQNVIIGKITYDPDAESVTLENPGTINKFNLLLGGSGSIKQENDPDIIGRFGEGMKLAALALHRPVQQPFAQNLHTHTRRLMIDTGGQRWLFCIQSDGNFDGHLCLFYKIRNLTQREGQNVQQHWTYTRMQGITYTEWKESYKHFTFFLKPEERMEIATIGNVSHKGSLLLEDQLRGHFFCKDLHIKDYKTFDYDQKDAEQSRKNFSSADPASTYYGFNTHEVPLNRDRSEVPNLWHKYDRCSCIMADVLNNMQQNLNLHPDANDVLHEMWTIVYWLLKVGRYEVHRLAQWANTATCNRIWKEWVKDRQCFPANENATHAIMPMYTSHQISCDHFLRSNSLESSFYAYRVLGNYLCAVLYKSSYYGSWSARFQALINQCQDSALNDAHNAVKQRLVSKLQRLDNTMTADRVCFKDAPLKASTSYFKDNKLYLANELLEDENRLFLKCLKLLHIDSSRLLQFCNL